MPFVENIDDIIINLSYWEKLRCNPMDRERYERYKSRIADGSRIFAYRIPDGFAFVPSKFLGNKQNNYENPPHVIEGGGDTTPEIDEIFDLVSDTNEELERKFIDFCELRGIKYQNQVRRYWNFDDLSAEIQMKISDYLFSETNLILYGPPGTGKTYNTVFEAVKICVGSYEANRLKTDRKALIKKYNDLTNQGKIEFITFHQSFSYQEFVEGLRPTTKIGNSDKSTTTAGFRLKPHDGIFKRISNRASRWLLNEGIDREMSVYQVSVNFKKGDEDRIKKCLENSIIFFDWSKSVDWTNVKCTKLNDFKKLWKEKVPQDEVNNSGGINQTFKFIYEAQIGDYVILTDGKEKFVAIGKIVGSYYYAESEANHPHHRDVNWLWIDENGKSHAEFYSEAFNNHSFYQLDPDKVDWDGLEELVLGQDLATQSSGMETSNPPQNTRGRFSGKIIKPLCETNPRRIGVHGWHSYEILLANPDGIYYEQYIKKGGRRRDLKWDYDRNWVSIEKSKEGLLSKYEPQKFVLIIDEINRANISKVFGELITLLEVDKRIGAENEVQVHLPYSGDKFGVPKNLHIIGTMNTADRSIALLDTALRRRFKFEEFMPVVEISEFHKIPIGKGNLGTLLNRINDRIEYLYDREHQIGHAFFIGCKNEADIEKVFRKDIIPLLAEYFYEDRGKMAKILEGYGTNERDKKFDGCFFEAELLRPKFPNIDGQDSDDEPKWRWIVKKKFNFERLKLP